jgi:hypothetical protein
VPLPTITISLGVPTGWILGDPVESILGTSTFLMSTSLEELTGVRGFKISRGRQHELDRVEAGKATVRFANRDGTYTPENASSPLYPFLRPMAPLLIQATYSAVTYDLFSGFLEAMPQKWTQGPAGDAVVEVRAVDAFKVFNLAKVTVTRGVEGAGARITALLDAIGWPASLRAIDDGDSNVQAVTLTNTSVLSHLQEVAASEGGVLFVSGSGVVTFFDRLHTVLLDEANDTWGDVIGEKPYEDLDTDYDDETLWNEVTVTAPGLADQTAVDSASQALFSGPAGVSAPRSLSVSTLLTTEAEMLERAEFLLSRYSIPQTRVKSITLDTRADAASVPRILMREIHDRIAARKRPPNGGLIDQPSVVEGMHWEYAASRYLRAVWSLSSTSYQQGQWELGTVGKSELGVTTTLVG